MFSMLRRLRTSECIACQWTTALLLLLPGVLAGQASGMATTQRVEIGAIAGVGGDYLPKGYLGIGVWSPSWRAQRIEVVATASVLWKAWHNNRDRVFVGIGEPDTSYLSSMARVGAEMRVGLSSHFAGVVRTGMVLGDWHDLPTADASRAEYLAPFGALGVAASTRRWAFDATLVGWKLRIGRRTATHSFETTIRRRF